MVIGLSVALNFFLLSLAGLAAGLLAGLLGVGGGVLIVPILWEFDYSPVEAAATSSLAILMIATSGTLQNWRRGQLHLPAILTLSLPALITAQIGALAANQVAPWILPCTFGLLLWITIYLVELRKRLATQGLATPVNPSSAVVPRPPRLVQLGTGSLAGFMAGFFGVGGGVILVPLQILLLGESLKTAIQNSLAVIVITALSALAGHAQAGNVVVSAGLLVGTGGLIGVQISTRFLPKLPDRVIRILFRTMLILLSLYSFWQAWKRWHLPTPL